MMWIVVILSLEFKCKNFKNAFLENHLLPWKSLKSHGILVEKPVHVKVYGNFKELGG